MDFLLTPELIAVLSLAAVLAQVQRQQSAENLRFRIAGVAFIVVEGVARMLSLTPTAPTLHKLLHVIALDAYLLAALSFLHSVSEVRRQRGNHPAYLITVGVPMLTLLTLYGAQEREQGVFLCICLAALVGGLVCLVRLRRPPVHAVGHALGWMAIMGVLLSSNFRLAVYLCLFFVYAATAVTFAVTTPRNGKGRLMLVAGFALWSLCFLTHPWLVEHHREWLPMAEKIGDLQKFGVTFGLLLASLEERNVASEFHALHDALTGLPNRRLFDDRLQQAVARASRNGSRVLLLNLDLDGFKGVNDRCGHEAGDTLLCEVGRRLQAAIRKSDTVARLGGDEFCLIVSDLPGAEQPAENFSAISDVIERFRFAVEAETLSYQPQTEAAGSRVGVSVGAAVFPDDAANDDDLRRVADRRMYGNKRDRKALTNVSADPSARAAQLCGSLASQGSFA